MSDSLPIEEEQIQVLEEQFAELCYSRMQTGIEEYGEFSYLGRTQSELFNMLYEELADQANYAMMNYVRLRLLEEALETCVDSTLRDAGQSSQHSVPSGPGSFAPGGALPGFLLPGDGVQDS